MHSLRPWVLTAACAAGWGLSPPPCAAAAAGTADARFQAIYTAEWRWREQQFPDNEDSQKPIQDHLPKVDPKSQELRLSRWQNVHRQLEAIPRGDSPPPSS